MARIFGALAFFCFGADFFADLFFRLFVVATLLLISGSKLGEKRFRPGAAAAGSSCVASAAQRP
jgi:hypothetical protein